MPNKKRIRYLLCEGEYGILDPDTGATINCLLLAEDLAALYNVPTDECVVIPYHEDGVKHMKVWTAMCTKYPKAKMLQGHWDGKYKLPIGR
jgi:hypothetical protein